MMVFVEGDLQITIDDALDARKFDGGGHGLSHCMKAVDFIVELPDKYLFIEFKDPDHPLGRYADQRNFIREFLSGELDEELKYKYRDSWLYEWASGRADKPVHYYVLVAVDGLTDIEFQYRTDDLERKLPVRGARAWTRSIVDACYVFNIRLWNHYLPNLPVSRVSAVV